MKEYKYVPNKKLGQNFLVNKEIIHKIVTIINPQYLDKILEIGPGLGALTYPIGNLVQELIVLEIDEKIILSLLKFKSKNSLRIILANAIKFQYFFLFLEDVKVKFRFIGNLPYNISTNFLLKIIRYKNNIYDMNFMFQKEVAERILAKPNTKKYGRLSIIVQSFFDVSFSLFVCKSNFFPVPKVDSIFLKFLPINKTYIYSFNKYFLAIGLVTKIAFRCRRKILRNSFKNIFCSNKLLSLGINPFLRAENLSVLQYFKLSEYFIKNINIQKFLDKYSI